MIFKIAREYIYSDVISIYVKTNIGNLHEYRAWIDMFFLWHGIPCALVTILLALAIINPSTMQKTE